LWTFEWFQNVETKFNVKDHLMLHVEDVLKQIKFLIYYYIYLGCSACKLARMHLCMCCVVVKLHMNKIVASGGHVHGALSPFQRWFTPQTLSLGLFTNFLYNNRRQGNRCYHVHHLYNIPWAPSSFMQKSLHNDV
jgi:hypothetical protein